MSVVLRVRRGCEHMFVKPVEREAARRLRREEGLALRVIAERLGRGEEQRERVDARHRAHRGTARAAAASESDLQPAASRAGGATGIGSRGTARGTGARAGGGAPRRSAAPPRLHALSGPRVRRAGTALCWSTTDVAMHESLPALPARLLRRRGRADHAEGQLPPQQRPLARRDRGVVACTTRSALRQACVPRRSTGRRPRPDGAATCTSTARRPSGWTPPTSCRASTARSRSTGASSALSGSTSRRRRSRRRRRPGRCR